MIFGRKKKDQLDEVEEVADIDIADDEESTAKHSPDTVDDGEDDGESLSENDEWHELDISRDWRADGPFDIHEVDLDADAVDRLDFGALVLTPFDGMQLQLQVDQETNHVQAVLVMYEQSAIEVSLFAAPASSSMLGDIRQEMSIATEEAGGEMSLAEGPFGTEIRRVIPLSGPQGEDLYHVSRTWFAQGPKWLLRGVLMGEAGAEENIDGPAELFYEFFSNVVVRRGTDPMVPGNLIPLTMPADLLSVDG